jgi:ABC-type uncharacterized transport system involved in gliding motility auxiliary subunit
MKTIKANLKYLKYLFWLGPMLVLAGLTAGVVSASGFDCCGDGIDWAVASIFEPI